MSDSHHYAKPWLSPVSAKPGDRVAIVSPAFAAPAVFPAVHERSMEVLRTQLQLVPVEYPTTRQLNASPEDRARDLMDAFSDASISAVLATIGGSDQITVLAHLDPDIFIRHPKRFFGYSDNTNFLNYLWNLGITSYHGGSTMVHLARPGGTHPISLGSLRSALFTNDTIEMAPVNTFSDETCDWQDLATLNSPVPTCRELGWTWHNSTRVIEGRTWGGNLEILHWNLAANRWIRDVEKYAGCILLLETSEEMPSADEVYRMLRNMGERGLLEQFPAVIFAKAKAWHHGNQTTEVERSAFRRDQLEALLRAMSNYNPDATVIYGPDFGHSDPQYIVPYGGNMRIDGPAQRIDMTY